MFKLSKKEKSWVLYDVGNSAFILLVTTIMPIYFEYIAKAENITSVEYLAYWGYATSIVTIIVAIVGPVLGTLSDKKKIKKKLFKGAVLVGTVSCALLGGIKSWLAFLALFIIAKVAYSISLIYYDSMLCDITEEGRMDQISSLGFAWGYIGSCIPFAIGLLFVLAYKNLGITFQRGVFIAFIVNAGWWLLCSLPLIKEYKQIDYIKIQEKKRKGARNVIETAKKIRNNRPVFLFLISYFFYIDGVFTIINMSTVYGKSLGLDSTGLLLALLITQMVAFLCAMLFGWLSHKVEAKALITICIVAYLGISIFAIFLSTQMEFWILAIAVGMFQGGIQALSRSYYAKIIPKGESGKYYGILDICGKGASFLGASLISVVSQLTGSATKGISVLSLLIFMGLFIFRLSVRAQSKESNINTVPKNLVFTYSNENE